MEAVVYDSTTGKISRRDRGNLNPPLYRKNYPGMGVLFGKDGELDWTAKYVKLDDDERPTFYLEQPPSTKIEGTTFNKPSFLEPHHTPKASVKEEGQDDLFLVRPAGIGDVILSLPAVRELRAKYPRHHITYWTTEAPARVLAGNPWIDEVRLFQSKYPKSPQPGMPDEVQMVEHDLGVNWAAAVDFGEENWEVHRADRFCELAGVEPPKTFGFPSILLTPEQREWASAVLAANEVASPLIASFVTSHGTSRYWPRAHWIALAERMDKHRFVWFSDEAFEGEGKPPGNVLNTCGQLNFEEFLALLAACDIILTPDTSGYHLGEMLGIPSVVLEGSVALKWRTKYYRHAHPLRLVWKLACQPCQDYQARSDCAGSPDAPWCLSRITSSRVERAIKRHL